MWAPLTALTVLALAGLGAAQPGPMRQPPGFRARSEEALRERRAFMEKHELEARWKNETKPPKTKYQFRNKKTEKFLVKKLPEVNFNFGELYAGSIEVDPANKTEGSLFFYFAPRTGGEPVEEITIWLNGGPGCSSANAFWQENGPISWMPGTFAPKSNPYAWSTRTNMLWVDQPIGTGFSVGKPYATSEEDITGPFLQWFKRWQETFGVKNYKIYITGESYAGRYVPYIGAAMVDANNTEHFDLNGIIVYDPCIGEYNTVQEEIPAVPFVEANMNLFGFNETYMEYIRGLHKSCGYEDFLNKYLVFPPSGVQPPTSFDPANPKMDANNQSCDVFSDIYNVAFSVNPCFNPYEVNMMCPLPSDSLGFPGAFVYSDPGNPPYFDRRDVKRALHAPDLKWSLCSVEPVFLGKGGPQFNGDTSPDPIQNVLPKVIEKTNRVLVANGDFDYIILTNGTLLAIQNMTWNGQLGFQSAPSTPFIVTEPDIEWTPVFKANEMDGLNGPQGHMGTYHYERGLMWVQTFMAGHMVPEYQPRAAILNLEWMLGRVESFGGDAGGNGTDANVNATAVMNRMAMRHRAPL